MGTLGWVLVAVVVFVWLAPILDLFNLIGMLFVGVAQWFIPRR